MDREDFSEDVSLVGWVLKESWVGNLLWVDSLREEFLHERGVAKDSLVQADLNIVDLLA